MNDGEKLLLRPNLDLKKQGSSSFHRHSQGQISLSSLTNLAFVIENSWKINNCNSMVAFHLIPLGKKFHKETIHSFFKIKVTIDVKFPHLLTYLHENKNRSTSRSKQHLFRNKALQVISVPIWKVYKLLFQMFTSILEHAGSKYSMFWQRYRNTSGSFNMCTWKRL